MRRRDWALLIVVATIAACSAQPSVPVTPTGSPSDSLLVWNVDGPTVELMLGTESIGVVPCPGLRRLAPGAGLPAWPWHLTVRATDGGLLNGASVAEVDVGTVPGGWRLLVRGRSIGVGLGQNGSVGPAPASCPPAPIPST